MPRFAVPVLALVAAAITAVLLAFLAHDALGIHRRTISINALAGAAFIGVALAADY
jgi:hypothetical protein